MKHKIINSGANQISHLLINYSVFLQGGMNVIPPHIAGNTIATRCNISNSLGVHFIATLGHFHLDTQCRFNAYTMVSDWEDLMKTVQTGEEQSQFIKSI